MSPVRRLLLHRPLSGLAVPGRRPSAHIRHQSRPERAGEPAPRPEDPLMPPGEGCPRSRGNDPGPCPAFPASTLLALYPGVRRTGWAVFAGRRVKASGTADSGTRRQTPLAERISLQLETLSRVVANWRPERAVRSMPGGLGRQSPGAAELERALGLWADGLGLPLTTHPAPDVRSAIAGRPNSPRDALAHAVMLRLGLIGQSRSAAEWEAIAAGCYHLQLPADGQVRSGPLG